jgi:hypothetical protein
MRVVYRLRSLFVAVIVAAAALAVIGAQPTLSVLSSELRPDLLELEPKDFTIQTTTSGEQRLLYDLETVNGHTGPLEVFPTKQKCATTGQGADGRTVKQRVYRDSNSNGYFDRGTDTQADIYTVGCMAFHRFHHHWHFDAFVGSFLWTLDESGARVSEVASSPKQSFCIADVHRRQDLFDPDLPGAPNNPYYRNCDRNSTQGLSVAWSDEYSSSTPGQYLVVTGLIGYFCFEATADPLAKLVEVSDTNNTDSIKIYLSGTSVTEYPSSTC